MEQISAADEGRGRNINKRAERLKWLEKGRKKLKLQSDEVVDGDSTKSSGEVDDETCCVDDDSVSYSDDLEENQLEDLGLPHFNALNPNNFVLTQIATKKATAMHIGQVQNRIEDTDENTFEVTFLRREKPKSLTFFHPNVEDISDVSDEDVVGKFPSPMVAQLVLHAIEYFLWTSPLIQMCCAKLSRSTHSAP